MCSFKKSKPTSGIAFLIFILNCGTTYPALHFHRGGSSEFLAAMKQHVSFEQKDPTFFIVKDTSKALYNKSLEELDLISERHAIHVKYFNCYQSIFVIIFHAFPQIF